MTQITKAARLRFLETLAATGNVPVAIDASGVSRHRLLVLRKDDPEFAQLWDEAAEAGLDLLEGEAMRRVLEGIEEPVYYHGKCIGKVRRYSDSLLIFLLKNLRPEKYGDKVKVDTGDALQDLLRAIDETGREEESVH